MIVILMIDVIFLTTHPKSTINPCKFFLDGNCRYGVSCWFDHVTRDQAVQRQKGPPAHVRHKLDCLKIQLEEKRKKEIEFS